MFDQTEMSHMLNTLTTDDHILLTLPFIISSFSYCKRLAIGQEDSVCIYSPADRLIRLANRTLGCYDKPRTYIGYINIGRLFCFRQKRNHKNTPTHYYCTQTAICSSRMLPHYLLRNCKNFVSTIFSLDSQSCITYDSAAY